jgi:hypothetical protein
LGGALCDPRFQLVECHAFLGRNDTVNEMELQYKNFIPTSHSSHWNAPMQILFMRLDYPVSRLIHDTNTEGNVLILKLYGTMGTIDSRFDIINTLDLAMGYDDLINFLFQVSDFQSKWSNAYMTLCNRSYHLFSDFCIYLILADDLNEYIKIIIDIMLDPEYEGLPLSLELPRLKWSGGRVLVPARVIFKDAPPLTLIIVPSSSMMVYWQQDSTYISY